MSAIDPNPPKGPTSIQYASAYTLDLYCVFARIDEVPAEKSPDGVHAWSEFPHTFIGETFSECARQAGKKGWIIDRASRTAVCPKCSAKRPDDPLATSMAKG